VQRYIPSWVVCLVLAVVVAHSVSVFSPYYSASFESSEPVTALARVHAGGRNSLFKNTSSVSHELSLKSERESKKVYGLLRRFDSASQKSPAEKNLRSTQMPTFLPAQLFFFRKLSPPSGTDDPFLR